MKAKVRFILAAVVLGLLMTGPFVVTSILVWLDMKEAERTMLVELLISRLPIGTVMTIFGFIVGLAILHKLFGHYVDGLLRMAETLRLMLGANRNFRVALEGPPEVQQLARAANDLAQQRNELLDDVDAQIARAKASLEEEKNRLAALMSELAQAVIVCNLDGRVLLYNNRARLQFKALAQGPTSVAGGALIGLGRSIFSILEKSQVTHAQEVIRQRLATGKAGLANFVTTTRGGQLLRVQMVPVLTGAVEGSSPPVMGGYVLTVENITRSIEQEARRDQVLHSLTEGSRAALGTLRAAVTNLIDYPDMEPELRERFVRIIDEEAARMSDRLDRTMADFSDSLKTRWPLEDVLGIDIVAAAQRRIEDLLQLPSKTEEMDDALWIKADSFSLVFAIAFLATRLQEHYEIRELRFRLSGHDRLAYLDIIWSGPAMSSETFYTWELEPMRLSAETTPLSLRDVIDRHGGEVWYQREKAAHRAFFRFVLPVAAPESAAVALDDEARARGRPEYYDFDLFKFQDMAGVDLDRRLTELVYTVFDTETTGLEPSNGDEIIQIGAVRIVNNRVLRQEIFNQLVDPQRMLRPETIPIHGITDDMVRGQPTIDIVLPAFREFCEDTVLIAHNAAFDMRFLQLKEASTGIRFGQPVLDTLLLSAVAHPNQESHKLDVILERLGITIETRHNAIDDSLATAEVFLKLVPVLAEKGIFTLRQALEASQQTYYARIKY
ncbi:MAG TPA: exonuclease domain-containing protein [Rhodocyclaceae bacterium]|jgi:DNA polymerase-3 subunit epsilon|nr:DNA polymerase III subunit epsilon [Betaproteobacteria bacterium]HMU99735.1 exonuclease domain-containing protein [Rhodocyclaceae bacterium]HMV20499.1 exonuclease domain-containing protein [Rhodocyclaceae bacterium]HMW76940.1 exonuclease domain-containing protein [Rhodocyclaceae bacterium]HNE43170.1 exonuclease domain-containing protein [Rhodocyclaceae bacterium]